MNSNHLEWDDAAFLLSRLPEHGGTRREQQVRARLIHMMREYDGNSAGPGPVTPTKDIRARVRYWREP